MITFETSLDIRCREVAPQVAKMRRSNAADDYAYIVIGTAYGHIHTSSGDIRYWKSYSGARRYLREYLKAGCM